MRFRSFCISFVVVVALVISCQGEHRGSDGSLNKSYYAPLYVNDYVVDSGEVARNLQLQINNDLDRSPSAKFIQNYYSAGRSLLWINREGIDSRVDTLMTFLKKSEHEGFSGKILNISQLEEDVERAKLLTFTSNQPASMVMARLEYNLSKTYLRYATIMGYGLVNPYGLYNRLDHQDNDSTGKKFRELYGVPTKLPKQSFYESAMKNSSIDSIGSFLRAQIPQDPLYHRLISMLNADSLTNDLRIKVLCNMERCRWHVDEHPFKHRKYVQVNLPGFRLYAVDGNQVLSMKVGAGTRRTKTPLLISRLKRIELNPQWIIPRSIVEKDIISHAEDPEYFERHHYFVQNKITGNKLNIYNLTAADLRNRDNHVVQEGGNGNSLGRIVFRFDNNYSVYLHHTSTFGFFNRDDRSVSHGCVRVEQPYDLACFLLNDKDEEFLQRINYSMTVDLKSPSLNKGKLVHSVTVSPEVPLFITYYTIDIDPTTNQIIELPDVYGYDRVLYEQLKKYGM